jgi:hypothetical protein
LCERKRVHRKQTITHFFAVRQFSPPLFIKKLYKNDPTSLQNPPSHAG